jgi:hypothetical protein
MKTYEILNKLKNIKNFIGVFPRDRLPKKVNWPMSLVVNTDKADEPGTHWIAIIIDKNGFGEYFDSYGLPPMHHEIVKFLKNNTNNYFYNKKLIQCLTCITCGHYCIAYIILRSKRYSYNYFIKLFTENQYKNDILIKKILKLI